MVYRILWSTVCMIRYTLLDLVMPTQQKTIDCRTVSVQERYIELFGSKTFYRYAIKFLDINSLFWVRMETYVTKNGIQSLFRHLTERSRRIVAASLAMTSTV